MHSHAGAWERGEVAKVTKSGRATEFYYDTGRSRFKRVDTNTSSGKKTTTLYLGSVEKLVHEDNTQEWRRTVGGVALITQLFNTAGSLSSTKTQYLLKDHLGSINVIADQNGIIKEEMAFDPWGKRRTTSDWRAMPLATVQANWFVSSKPETNRGFTGHEMVDEMEIIHMNGRIYDPLLGRFLQADPVIQDPTQTASLNRYSYCWNNPLNATDPSGYSLTKLFRRAIRDMVHMLGSESANNLGSLIFGKVVWSYNFSRAMGATSGNAFRSASVTAIVAVASMAIGGMFPEGGLLSAGHLTRIALHGLVGGIAAELSGGKFGHGFVSSAITEFASPANAGINGVMKGSVGVGSAGWVTRITMAAIVGGTVSELTGGKFKNGAQTAALQRMFNGEEHMGGDEQKGFIGNEADSMLKKARGLVGHERSKRDVGEYATVGATIGYTDPSFPSSMFVDPELKVLMVGEQIAVDGVGANPNNIGGMDSRNALAIYVNESNSFDHSIKYGGGHYQSLADRFKTTVVVEVHDRFNDSRAAIFRAGSSEPEIYTGGMKY